MLRMEPAGYRDDPVQITIRFGAYGTCPLWYGTCVGPRSHASFVHSTLCPDSASRSSTRLFLWCPTKGYRVSSMLT
jgi:hypothetical protein